MLVRRLHPWNVDVARAVELQESLRDRVVLRGSIRSLRLVAGCDVAYHRWRSYLVGGAVVWDVQKAVVVESRVVRGESQFRYVPGLLSFRELPVLLEALSGIQARVQVVLVDGQGVAHPRGMGIATHLGLHLDVPTVGCAKSPLVGDFSMPGPRIGDRAWMIWKGVRVGAVLRTREAVRPVFVSPGHGIGLQGALRVVMSCLKGRRIPEPLREAHLLVEKAKRAMEAEDQAVGCADSP